MKKQLMMAVCGMLMSAPLFASQLLGSTTLTRQENDVDVLRFSSCRGGVAQLKVQVRAANAEIEAIVVHFANGELMRLDLRQRFKKGAASRWVDLPGKDRCISKIKIVGDSEVRPKQARAQARVEIFGR